MTHPRIAVYPGSFDPVTNGHLDIIRRASRLFDRVIVAVTRNSTKTSLFSIPERVALLGKVLKPSIVSGDVEVDAFHGLLADYCRKRGAKAVVRGLRALSDFEYEFQMALMNRHLSSDLETVFLMSDEKYTYLSSSLLKDVVRLGGDAGRFVPSPVIPVLKKKLAGRASRRRSLRP